MVEVGREGHSKRQRNKVTVSGDNGEISRGQTSEHVRLLWPRKRGCLSSVTGTACQIPPHASPAVLPSPTALQCWRVSGAADALTWTSSQTYRNSKGGGK